jgi:hypothetical protein
MLFTLVHSMMAPSTPPAQGFGDEKRPEKKFSDEKGPNRGHDFPPIKAL